MRSDLARLNPGTGVGEGTPGPTCGLNPELEAAIRATLAADHRRGAWCRPCRHPSPRGSRAAPRRASTPACRGYDYYARRSHQPPASGPGSTASLADRRRLSFAISRGSRPSAGPREPVGWRSPGPSTEPRCRNRSPPRAASLHADPTSHAGTPPLPGQQRSIASMHSRRHKRSRSSPRPPTSTATACSTTPWSSTSARSPARGTTTR